MANYRSKTPRAVKDRLIREAGDKCANPGCTTVRAQIHHIMEWHVYGTHDPDHMIAVCPSCHDEIHHGRLGISDDTLYGWKGIDRPSSTVETGLIFVSPSENIEINCGSVRVKTKAQELVVFELSNSNRLGFRIEDGEILLLSLRLTDRTGNVILKVVNNRVRVNKDKSLTYESRAGRVLVTAPPTLRYIDTQYLADMRQAEPQFAADDRLIVIDLEVIAPGSVKLLGFWQSEEGAIIVTPTGVNLIRPGKQHARIEGIHFEIDGPVTPRAFGFMPNGAALFPGLGATE
jgi:hypothetical protein